MDLKLMSEVRQATQHQKSQKNTEAFEQHYQQGLHLLAQAQASGFSRTDELTQAHQEMIIALQACRQDPKPYVALAYLSLLVGARTEAVHYLKMAREYAPENPDVQAFMEVAQTMALPSSAQQKPTLQVNPLLNMSPKLDFDDLYEKVEALIYQETQRLAQTPPLPPSAERDIISQLKNHVSELQSMLVDTQKRLKIVEEEIDCDELRSLLLPLEKYHKQMLERYQMSEDMSHMKTEILQTGEQVIQLKEKVSAQPTIATLGWAEQSINPILDSCDRIADRLDAIESKGYSIRPLEIDYEALIRRIESLQDFMDDVFPQT